MGLEASGDTNDPRPWRFVEGHDAGGDKITRETTTAKQRDNRRT